MKVLIIDQDTGNAARLSSHIELRGHKVRFESVRGNDLSHLKKEEADIIFVDSTSLAEPEAFLLNVRRIFGNYTYIILGGSGYRNTDNANVTIANFYEDMDAGLDATLESAARLLQYAIKLNDDSLDFPSAGGIIAKSAFNQLFLSMVERSYRYGEVSYIAVIEISNYAEILAQDGPYYASSCVAKIAQQITEMRRQSDIIGQTARGEYSLLLLAPQAGYKPEDAASRFLNELSKIKSPKETVESDPEIAMRFLEVPTGRKIVEHHITLGA